LRVGCSEDLSCSGWDTRGGVNGGDEGGKLEHLSSTRAVCEVPIPWPVQDASQLYPIGPLGWQV
jgi:hypothetical protein